MDLFLADDARQNHPSRDGMTGPLVAFGGVHVPDGVVGEAERGIENFCAEFGFPPGEPFKWSPRRDHWMRTNLVDDRRRDFLTRVLTSLRERDCHALVVIEEEGHKPAIPEVDAETDVTLMFLERVENNLLRLRTNGLVIAAQPSGQRDDEHKFLTDCLTMLRSGTKYVRPERIALNVLSTPSALVRLLQVADVVVSCAIARVSGEDRYSPAIFDVLRPMLFSELSRIGGVGLKIHPDLVYGNLYHWLLGDTHLWKGSVGNPLPHPGIPYATGANVRR
jgi:hypothetical protein